MATLAVQQVVQTGAVVTTQAAASGGDKLAPGTQTWLEVTNASGSSKTVTVDSVTPSNYGTDVNLVVAVADGTTARIGPLPESRFASQSDGLCSVSYSAATGLSVAAVKV